MHFFSVIDEQTRTVDSQLEMFVCNLFQHSNGCLHIPDRIILFLQFILSQTVCVFLSLAVFSSLLALLEICEIFLVLCGGN